MDEAELEAIVEEALNGSEETSELSLAFAEDYQLDEPQERSYLQWGYF